jgi:hypothetical protein
MVVTPIELKKLFKLPTTNQKNKNNNERSIMSLLVDPQSVHIDPTQRRKKERTRLTD